jgi:hypothetical protein
MVAPDLVSEEDIAELITPDDLPNEGPSFKAYIEAKVYDKEGHLIQHHEQSMRSLTQYFLALMSIPLIGTYQGPSTYQAPNILTNVLGLPSQQSTYTTTSANGANITWDWSIQLGSGTQAFSPSLTSLAAPILNGTGANMLSYGTVNVAYAGTSIIISVVVTNYTSSTINVSEIGLECIIYLSYQNSSDNFTYTTYNFLLSYDVFSTPISIPAAGFAAFQITLSFTG